MAKVRSWVGLDVHARSVLAVSIDGESGELCSRRLSGVTSEVVQFCCSLPGPTRVAYEAGPTGYGLARSLRTADVACVVAAPGKIERPAGDKVKTDQRDAERVLRLLMIDGLHPVRVPTGEEEALRDVVRAREAVRGDVDVIDFTDTPLSENWGRNEGLAYDVAMRALDTLAASPRLAGLTVTELNPDHTEAGAGTLERFASALAGSLAAARASG